MRKTAMATMSTIKQQIEKTVGKNYSDWQISTTNDPIHRKAQLGNPLSWLQWKAESEQTALLITQYFHKKGMQNAGKPPKSAEYVYMLLVHTPNDSLNY